jgi:hypothetical protein
MTNDHLVLVPPAYLPLASEYLKSIVEVAATYVVQSTLIIGTVWIVMRLIPLRGPRISSTRIRPATAERLWKVSAILGLCTAPISVCSGWSHPAWEWSFGSQSGRNPPVVAAVSVNPEHRELDNLTTPLQTLTNMLPVTPDEAGITGSMVPVIALETSPGVTQSSVDVTLPVFKSTDRPSAAEIAIETAEAIATPAVVYDLSPPEPDDDSAIADAGYDSAEPAPHRRLIFVIGMMLLGWTAGHLIRLTCRGRLIRRQLRGCQPIEGDLRQDLDRLVPRGHTIRLLRSAPTVSRADASGMPRRTDPFSMPFACGLWHWTIVLPAGIEQGLTRGEMKALLAHEVAHLVRRDPWWLFLGAILCSCLVFQPLNLVARLRWQQATELMCDDWAVHHLVSPTSLARCLTRIAEWKLDRRSAVIGLNAVGPAGSLIQRIEWLLRTGRGSEPERSPGRMAATLLIFSAGIVVGGFGPRLSFLSPAEASDELALAILRQEIDGELTVALDELSHVERQLLRSPAPEVASMTQRLRESISSLRSRQHTHLRLFEPRED